VNRKLYILGALFLASLAIGGPIKSWSGNEYITAADLNANFTHLHNSVGHGHGGVIVNADVAGSAAIAHSKMATPALLPKLWATTGATACNTATCTLTDSSSITSITRTSAGVYTANFTARANVSYGVLATSHIQTVACYITGRTATTFGILCFDSATGAVATDSSFTVMLLDSDN
jgi:hypothetical protein